MSVDDGRMVGLLARLVACDTQNPPGAETAAAELVTAHLTGFETAVVPVAPGRANAIAVLRRGEGPSVCFNTHLDTVPVGDGWTSDPLRLTARDGRLFGRGACDAKGSLAAMVEALLLLAADGTWRGTLVGAFVVDEEIGGTGAIAAAGSFPAFDGVVVGEPTGNTVRRAHRGCVRPTIRVSGVAAHSSTPDLGRNAITAAAALLDRIADHDRDLARRTHPLLGRATVTATRIAGGNADNIVPAACDIVLDRRLLPDETPEAAMAEITAILGPDANVAGIRAAAHGCETAADAPTVRAALAACARHGTLAEAAGFPGGCDLVHFARRGSPGIILGPGSLDLAHKPDEFVPVADLVQAALIYRDFALTMFARS